MLEHGVDLSFGEYAWRLFREEFSLAQGLDAGNAAGPGEVQHV